jgi:hypothetical protein
MLPSLVGLPCGPPQRHAAPCGVSMPPVQPLGVELKKQLRYPTMETQPPPPPPGLFDSFSDDIVEYIMSFDKGMDCKEIARQCITSKAFNRMCQKDEFWKWQCQLHGFTHPYFLVPRGPLAQEKDDGPWWDKRVETWKAHYTFWCKYISHLAKGVAYNLHS